MGKSKKFILVYKDMPHIESEDRLSIVLTPQNYILKREKIPVKKEYQAKKIVGSVFNNILDDINLYSFYIYRDFDEWIFIAYRIDEIEKLLRENNIKLGQVQDIFFAQQFIQELSNPINMGSLALINLNNIATVISKEILPEDSNYIDNINFISKVKPIYLRKKNVIVNGFLTKSVSIFAILLAILYLLEIQFVIKKEIGDTSLNDISNRYMGLQSSYTRSSILSKYRQINRIERIKRDLIKYIFEISKKGVKLDKFDLSSTTYNIILTLSNDKLKDRVVKELKSKGFKIQEATSKQIVLKGKL